MRRIPREGTGVISKNGRIAAVLTLLLAATSALSWTGQPLAYVGTANNTVTVIDTGDNKVVDSIPVDIPPSYIAVTPDAKHVYVAGGGFSGDNGSVAVIDTSQDRVVTTLLVPYGPAGMVASPDGTRVYVVTGFVDQTDVLVSVIDTATNAIVATIDVPELFPSGIAISPDGKRVYVAIQGGLSPYGSVAVIDTATNSLGFFVIPDSLAERFFSVVVSPDNGKLYATGYFYPPGDNLIAVFDPVTGGFETTIPDVMSLGIFSPDGKHLYGVGLGGVAVLDTTTNAATTAIANLPGAGGLAITPDGRHLYITGGDSVVVADTLTNTILSTIGGVTGSGAIGIVPAPSIVPSLSAFKVSSLDIHVDEGRFKLRSEFAREVSSSGLDPQKQPVRLQVGPFITTIPAGSFKQGHAGYDFEGVVDGVHLSVTIKPIGASRYAFDATASGASLTGVANPVQVSLNINTQGGALADVSAR